MKKFLPVLVLFVIAVGAWYISTSGKSVTSPGVAPTKGSGPSESKLNDRSPKEVDTTESDQANIGGTTDEEEDEDTEGLVDETEKKATEIFTNADDALKAIKEGAKSYDDLVLEQFASLGEDCTWCPALYQQVKDLMVAPDTTQEQRSFYAELLAISNRVENISSLVEAIKSSPEGDNADAYTEALELTQGDDNVVKYLAEQLDTKNDALKESLIAAITNHGTRTAAETLYNQAVASNDPDGLYSLGIGLGELVPEPETLPFLQEIAKKRDPYSHLAVKALLNSGIDGLKIVFDILAAGKDQNFDRQMLKDAVDHVAYDEDIEAYVKKMSESSQGVAQEFAKQITDDFNNQQIDDTESDPLTGGQSTIK